MITVSVLGRVEVHRDGQLVRVPAGKTTEVLVRLALDAGRLVRAEQIIDDVWADAAPSTGRNTLQSKVSQLRRALHTPGLLAGSYGGYTLGVDPRCVDALHVTELAGAAAALRSTGDAAGVLDLTTRALELFRGEALVDAGDGDWLRAHRVRLEEVRLGLVEDRLAAKVELPAGGEVIGELEELIQRHPLREGLWFSLITALYRAGRQAEALAAYQRVRDTLTEELGIEPGPDLRRLEEQILRQSPDLEAAGRRPPVRSGPPAGNLPGLSSPLVGRVAELAELTRLRHTQRLVTVVGPAGVGKTRLAIEAARAATAPGGTWLVRLDAADGTTSMAQLVAETLKVAGGEQMLSERVAAVRTLLIFDNCEHVVAAVADLTSRLLDVSSQLHVLATSQRPLGLDGECTFTLGPLPIDDSVDLFARRATEMRRQFALNADTETTVADICRALDGLPLAIELAAARVKTLSVTEIARRLDDRFALVQDPTSRRPERRRALAGALAWSYDLLFPDDQWGLWALACFAGGATLAAAEHVLGALGVPPQSALDVVGRLVDRSLVSVDVSESAGARYRLLDSIRAFAIDKLTAAGLATGGFAAHAAWFAAAADYCAQTVRGREQPACVAFARTERADIDAALNWAAVQDPALGVRMANGFGWTWVVLGDGVAGAARVRDALGAAAHVVSRPDKAKALLLAGWLEASAGNLVQAESDLQEARSLAEQLQDPVLRAGAYLHVTFLRVQQGRAREALDLAHASLTLSRRLQLTWESATSLVLAAFASMVLGDNEAAVQQAQEAVELILAIGDSWGLVHADAMLGAIAQADHRFEEAAERLARTAAASEQLGFLGQAAFHLTQLGRIQQRAGDSETARVTLPRAIEVAINCGDLRMAATARLNLARVLRASPQPDDASAAVTLLEQNHAWYRDFGGGDGDLLSRCLLASLSSDAAGLEAALAEARDAGDQEVELLSLDAVARMAAGANDSARAHGLLAAADELALGMEHLVDEADRVDAHRARALIE